jgi:hypothetical protein
MFDHHRADLSSLTSQSHEIQGGIDAIKRKLEDSEMADLRASEHFTTSVH